MKEPTFATGKAARNEAAIRCAFLCLAIGLFSMGFVQAIQARVSNPNPNVIISIVGDENVVIAQPGGTSAGFSVRVTNPQGVPISGIVVEFFANATLCAPLQPCNAPPVSLYGYFAGKSVAQSQFATTDANGIARSGGFIGGMTRGTYEVAASIFCFGIQVNCSVLQGQGSPTAYFGITQAFMLLDGYMSGNWYDPARGGQGLQLEFTDQNNLAIAIWFVFGPDGGQNWIYAQGAYDLTKNSVTLPASISTGTKFPPLYNSTDIRSTAWGSITLSFADCNTGTMTWNSTLPGYGSGTMSLTRLTSIRGIRCPG